MVLVRLLLFLALATIVVATVMYLFKRDRRYLRFIWQVIKYTILFCWRGCWFSSLSSVWF